MLPPRRADANTRQVCPRALTRQAGCPFRDRTHNKRLGSVTGKAWNLHGYRVSGFHDRSILDRRVTRRL
ncbi:hypothetical protein CU044_7201 [Streptomyces sp. L-9-10]|nr:hypothetical protein CU044_7201 [Streptomyces sp. L-9-10]